MTVEMIPHTPPPSGGPAAPITKEAAFKAASEKFAKPDAQPPKAPEGQEPPKVETKPEQTDLKNAIEIERAHREREKVKGEAELVKQRLQHYESQEAARKSDWRRALSDHGHNIEEVVMQWVGSENPKPKAGGQQSEAPSGDRRYDQLMSEHEALKNEFHALRDTLRDSGQKYSREQRLESLRGIVRGADDYEVVGHLEAEDSLLSYIEAQEKERGDRLGENELREAIGGYESKSRETIERQFQQLAKSKWGRQRMQQMLAELTEASAPAPNGAAPPARDLMNSDASTVTRTRELNREEFRAEAMRLAQEKIARRNSGLG